MHCTDAHCPRVCIFNVVCAVVLFLSFVVYNGSFGSEQSSQILAFSARILVSLESAGAGSAFQSVVGWQDGGQ